MERQVALVVDPTAVTRQKCVLRRLVGIQLRLVNGQRPVVINGAAIFRGGVAEEKNLGWRGSGCGGWPFHLSKRQARRRSALSCW